MTNFIKAYLDIFLALSVLIAFGQDIYNLSGSASSASSVPSSSGSSNVTESLAAPEISGVVIKVTDNLRKPLQDLLVAEKYNVKVESYKFEGGDWWFETIINYGHMVLVYMLMSKYKSETNEQTKKKIMLGGGVAVVAWFFLMPQFKQQRLAIEIKGVNVYESNKIIPNEIVGQIADELDLAQLSQAPTLEIEDEF